MTRKQVVRFTGAGPAWPAAYVGFYSDSGATTAVTVYADQIASTVLASGKTGSSPVRNLRADGSGSVPPASSGVALWVDSSVTTLYARPETVTGVAVGGTAAVSVASYGPDGPVAPVDPSSQTGWTKGALDTEIAGQTRRVLTAAAPGATPAINTDLYDVAEFTGLAAAVTSMTSGLTGTPVAGQRLRVALTDNGTARAITWGASFEASTVALPTTTVISTRLDVSFVWNAVTSKWRCVSAV